VTLAILVRSAIRVHRIPPRVRDDRDTPLEGDETARETELIWVGRERIYFFEWDWTDVISLMSRENFLVPCNRKRRPANSSLTTGFAMGISARFLSRFGGAFESPNPKD